MDNTLRRRAKAGTALFGVDPGFAVPDVVEFIGALGFDFVFLDGEHGSVGPEGLPNLLRAAELSGIAPLVRVPSNDHVPILSFLDAGALSLVVPHCSTPADAARALAYSRYPPHGQRGAHTRTRAARFGTGLPPVEYFLKADEEVLVMPMIEDREALEHLDDILAVDGLEAIFIGPGDLAISLGYPGAMERAEVADEVARVARAASQQGILVGCLAGSDAWTSRLLEAGVTLFLGSMTALAAGASASFLAHYRALGASTARRARS